MIYKLSTTKQIFNSEYELEYMGRLKKRFGFTFHRDDTYHNEPTYYINDEKKITIEINTLEELNNLVKEFGDLIVRKDSIQIYDDYTE